MKNSTFDDSIKEEVRSKADFTQVIGRYVKLEGKGNGLKGLCPFHNEKTPSFHVNAEKGFFHCFGCGKGGDIFKFIEEIENVSFFEALKMLAEETGVELTQKKQLPNNSSSSIRISKTELLQVHEFAANYYYAMIKTSPQAVEYFKSRGLAPEVVRDFRLGYAPAGWSPLINHCKISGSFTESLVPSGLAIEKEGGGTYDRFRNRIMFSLFDLSGKVIGFAGRAMTDKEMPKYLNSPETPLYKKKELLYGLFMSRQAIKECGCALVVEGYMDFLTLFQNGIKNVVAVSGTAFTIEHAQLLKRFCSKIILVFDGDVAGQQAAKKAVQLLSPIDIDVLILVLPDGEDPDDFVKKKGPDKFRELLKTARSWIPFIIDTVALEHDAGTPHGKSAIVTSLQYIIQSISDPIVAQSFKKELADRIGLDEQIIYKKMQSPRVRNAAGNSQQVDARRYDEELLSFPLESSFLNILLTSPELIQEAKQYVIPETLTNRVSSDIYSLIIDTFEKTGSIEGILDRTHNPGLKKVITSLCVKNSYPGHVHEELVQKIIRLREKYIRMRIRDAKLKMKNEPNRRVELLKDMQDFTTQLQELQQG